MANHGRSARCGVWALSFGVLSTLTLSAEAQSSGGSGGPPGEQDGWPCTGCLFATGDGYDSTQAAPLLVTFHGDEGHPRFIHRRYYGTDRQPGPARTRGFLVLSLQCPVDRGCASADPEGDPSWWRWRGTDDYDPDWVGAQVDAVEAAYDVSLTQIYLASFSGGSSFLRRYAFEQADRFAGALIGGGGGVPQRNGCFDTCKVPIFISIGTEDFLFDLAQGTREYADRCGHELFYSEHPGVEHTIVQEDLPVALDWFLDRPHVCLSSVPPPTGSGGGPSGEAGAGGTPPPGTGGASGGSAGGSPGMNPGGQAGAVGSPGTGGTGNMASGGGPGESESDLEDMLADHQSRSGSDGGCSCRTPHQKPSPWGGWVAVLAGVLAASVRRRPLAHRRAEPR